MKGVQYIQQSTLLRSQGHYLEAMACIEKNIHKIDEQLKSTAWQEARFAAQALKDFEISAFYAQKAKESISARW